jgi:hypothetical protein
LVTEIRPVLAPAGTFTLMLVAERTVAPGAGVPSKETAEEALKPIPVIVTSVPGAARLGASLMSDNDGVNLAALVADLAGVVTLTVATGAPLGTTASSWLPEIAWKVVVSDPNRTCVTRLSPVPAIVTVAPVIAEAGLTPVIEGSAEVTMALAAEAAGVPPAVASAAVTTTRILRPTVPAPSSSVAVLAPLSAVQMAPELLQDSHW